MVAHGFPIKSAAPFERSLGVLVDQLKPNVVVRGLIFPEPVQVIAVVPLEAVYDYFVPLPRIRFLLADDPGAGKTIMAGLLLKELKVRGLIRRTLEVTACCFPGKTCTKLNGSSSVSQEGLVLDLWSELKSYLTKPCFKWLLRKRGAASSHTTKKLPN